MVKKQRVCIVIVLCCLLVFMISGCKTSGKNSEGTQKVEEEKSHTISPTSIPTITPTITPTVIPTNIPIPTPTVIPTMPPSDSKDEGSSEVLDDLTNFKKLQDGFIDYDFKITRNGTQNIPDSFKVEGKCDLNNDGKADNIKMLIKGNADIKSYLEVNDIKQEFDIDNSYDGEVRIVDLDQNDNYLEVACFDEGPSGDPAYLFFRYDGVNLYEIGSIDAFARIDEQGKLISSFHISWQFRPSFCSAWYEIENNTLVKKNNDIDKYLELTYDFNGGDAYFIPFDKIPDNLEIGWEETKRFEATKVKLIDILYLDSLNRTLNFYFVTFPSGEKGLLYFWIGD